MVKGRLTSVISFKYHLFLSESNHWSNNLREVLYKATVEIAEVDKELHLGEICRSRSFDNCLYLSRVHLQSLDE